MSKAPAIQARHKNVFLATSVVLLFALAGPLSANGALREITSPTDGEIFYANEIIELIAYDEVTPNNYPYWAVRHDTCDTVKEKVVAGNVADYTNPYIWENGAFNSAIDAIELVNGTFGAGDYCFAFNTDGGEFNRNNPPGIRLTRWFTVSDVFKVGIDIKPGSDPNCFNINGHGVIPVAILGSDSFDVASVDPGSLSFGGLAVRVRGKKGPQCGLEDINEDGYLDLVCQFEDDDSAEWNPGEEEAAVMGGLYDGTKILGSDSICIVP